MTRRQSFQQGHISGPIRTRRGDAYRIRYRVRTGNGKWRHKTETLYDLPGKKAARAVLQQRVRDCTTAKVQASEMTFTDFVEGVWRPYLQRKGVKPATMLGYDCILRKHVRPQLGEMQLTDIAPIHIEKLLQAKSAMSAKSQRNIVVLLQSIFSVAVDNDLLSGSPVRKRHKPKLPRAAKTAWTPEQVRQIVDAVPADHRPLFLCVALTGVRLGELLGLRWKNVDFLSGTIHVERSLWNGELQSPKTEASTATVPMKSMLKKALTELRRRGFQTQPESFVFCKNDGTPLHPDVLRKDVLYPTLDRLGIPRQRRASGFHAFRHAAATAVQSTTKDMLAAQRLLRHASYSTTADIYVHSGDAAQNAAAEALQAAIFPEELFQIVPNFGTSSESEQ